MLDNSAKEMKETMRLIRLDNLQARKVNVAEERKINEDQDKMRTARKRLNYAKTASTSFERPMESKKIPVSTLGSFNQEQEGNDPIIKLVQTPLKTETDHFVDLSTNHNTHSAKTLTHKKAAQVFRSGYEKTVIRRQRND